MTFFFGQKNDLIWDTWLKNKKKPWISQRQKTERLPPEPTSSVIQLALERQNKNKHWAGLKMQKKTSNKPKNIEETKKNKRTQKSNIDKLFGEGPLEKNQKNIEKKQKKTIFTNSLGRAPFPRPLEYCFFFVLFLFDVFWFFSKGALPKEFVNIVFFGSFIFFQRFFVFLVFDSHLRPDRFREYGFSNGHIWKKGEPCKALGKISEGKLQQSYSIKPWQKQIPWKTSKRPGLTALLSGEGSVPSLCKIHIKHWFFKSNLLRNSRICLAFQ